MNSPRPSRRQAVWMGLGAGIGSAFWAAWPDMALAESKRLAGQPAPEFTRQTLQGGTVSLHALRGRVVLLNFWASWCAPCLQEMPVFDRWAVEEKARGLAVVGVAMDDDPEPVRTVVARLQLRYPVVRGNAALGRLFGGILGLPVSFLIDSRGIVRQRVDGAADLAAMHRELLLLLH